LYDILKVNSNGEKHLEKIEDTSLSVEQHIEYMIRLNEANKDGNGSISLEEFIEAMGKTNFTNAEKNALWKSRGWKDTNNPYK